MGSPALCRLLLLWSGDHLLFLSFGFPTCSIDLSPFPVSMLYDLKTTSCLYRRYAALYLWWWARFGGAGGGAGTRFGIVLTDNLR